MLFIVILSPPNRLDIVAGVHWAHNDRYSIYCAYTVVVVKRAQLRGYFAEYYVSIIRHVGEMLAMKSDKVDVLYSIDSRGRRRLNQWMAGLDD